MWCNEIWPFFFLAVASRTPNRFRDPEDRIQTWAHHNSVICAQRGTTEGGPAQLLSIRKKKKKIHRTDIAFSDRVITIFLYNPISLSLSHSHSIYSITLTRCVTMCFQENCMYLQLLYTETNLFLLLLLLLLLILLLILLLLLFYSRKQLKEHLVSRAIIRSDDDGLPREIETNPFPRFLSDWHLLIDKSTFGLGESWSRNQSDRDFDSFDFVSFRRFFWKKWDRSVWSPLFYSSLGIFFVTIINDAVWSITRKK